MARPPKAARPATIKIPLIPSDRPWFDPATGKPTAEFAKAFHDLVRRTGGQTSDDVATALSQASTAASTASANSAGVVVPTPGGAVELTPTNPLSYTATGILTSVDVAQHTRTGAAAPILAGSVSVALRATTYQVWYRDLANVGGAVTFVAEEDLTNFDASLGDRFIGSVFIPSPSPTSGVEFAFIA